jgi:hypothetical protein
MSNHQSSPNIVQQLPKQISNPQPNNNAHKLISQMRVQPPTHTHHTNTISNIDVQSLAQHKCQLPSPYPSYNNNFQNKIKSFSELAKLCLVVTDEKGLTILNIGPSPAPKRWNTIWVTFCESRWVPWSLFYGALHLKCGR